MREAIAIVLDLHQDDFGLMMQIVGPAALADLSERFAEQRRVAADAQAEARKILIAITTAMKSEGLTIRELGVVLGVSHQRAHQLVSVARRQPMPATKIGDRDHKAATSNVKSKRISA